MIGNLKNTPMKNSSKPSNHFKSIQDEETIDTSTFGQRSGKSSNEQFIKQKNQPIIESIQCVKQNLFLNNHISKQSPHQQQQEFNSQDQSSETDQNNQSENQQLKILTQKQYKQIINQDLVNLKQLQWLIKTFNKSNNFLNKYAQKVVNKVQRYFKKSIFKAKQKAKKIEFQQCLIDQITKRDDNCQDKKDQTTQFTLICNQYVLFSKQIITKSLEPNFAPYRQQYIQSILLVIDDLSTFKKLANDDLRNQICQIIEDIEKNLIGKDQKKYARQIYRSFVNQMFKKIKQEDKFYQ